MPEEAMEFVHPPIFEYTHPLPENELRAGRYTKRPHNNRTGGRKRANKLQMRQVSAYNRLQRSLGEA